MPLFKYTLDSLTADTQCNSGLPNFAPGAFPLQVPFLFKYTIDSLTADPTALTPATVAGVLALTPPALIVGYGVARAGASFCNEARNAVFAKARGGCGVGVKGRQRWCAVRRSCCTAAER